MFTYLEREIIDSLRRKMYSFREEFTVGRRVEIIAGHFKGTEGVVQNFTHDKNKPLQDDKIRVWVNGYSCTDIFDFDERDLKLIPYESISGLGYF